jgi:UTP--glucose-1-phosphate uridylyltransferase
MYSPFMANSSRVDAQLAALSADTRATLERYGFDQERFRGLSHRVASGLPDDNTVRGELSPPEPGDIQQLPQRGPERERLVALGSEALRRGQVALVVLAGGMATRMGGVVKALVEALPGKTFLELRLEEMDSLERKYGKAPPLWLMTSHSTEHGIREALGERLDGERIGLFSQFLSLRLTPDGQLFLDASGRPSEHAPGHGDLPSALQKSGLLTPFVQRGGRVVMVTNLDNLGGTLDPAIIGWHLAHGDPVTAEVVEKLPGDRGGIPVRVDGAPCILEEFRIPKSFDPASVRVFATNVFHFDARTLAELDIPWTYFRVTKQVEGKPVLQFERLINEVSSFLPTRYLLVPRSGEGSRFLPVKDNEELKQRRREIELVASSRGMLG